MLDELRARVADNDPDQIDARAVVDHPAYYPAPHWQEARARLGLPDPCPRRPHPCADDGVEGMYRPEGEPTGDVEVGGIF